MIIKKEYKNSIALLVYKASFSSNPPKNEDEKYAYDMIEKAYWINEKKIEMLDYQKRNKLIENYYRHFGSRKK